MFDSRLQGLKNCTKSPSEKQFGGRKSTLKRHSPPKTCCVSEDAKTATCKRAGGLRGRLKCRCEPLAGMRAEPRRGDESSEGETAERRKSGSEAWRTHKGWNRGGRKGQRERNPQGHSSQKPPVHRTFTARASGLQQRKRSRTSELVHAPLCHREVGVL